MKISPILFHLCEDPAERFRYIYDDSPEENIIGEISYDELRLYDAPILGQRMNDRKLPEDRREEEILDRRIRLREET